MAVYAELRSRWSTPVERSALVQQICDLVIGGLIVSNGSQLPTVKEALDSRINAVHLLVAELGDRSKERSEVLSALTLKLHTWSYLPNLDKDARTYLQQNVWDAAGKMNLSTIRRVRDAEQVSIAEHTFRELCSHILLPQVQPSDVLWQRIPELLLPRIMSHFVTELFKLKALDKAERIVSLMPEGGIKFELTSQIADARNAVGNEPGSLAKRAR